MQDLKDSFDGTDINELSENLGIKRAINENRVVSKPLPSEEEACSFPEKISRCPDVLKAHGMKSCCSIPIFEEGKPKAIILLFSEKEDFLKGIEDLFDFLKDEIQFVLNALKQEIFLKIILTAVEHGFDFVVVTDKDFKIVYVNTPSARKFGYLPEELIGKHHSIFSSKLHTKEFVKRFYQTITSGEIFSDYFIYKAKDGSLVHTYTTIIPLKQNGEIRYYVSVGRDISREKALLEKLDYLLTRDPLTDLLNTKGFLTEIQAVLRETEVSEQPVLSALIVLNPLEFEDINRAFGHSVGDKVLVETARRLKKAVYETDILAKLDSSHFAVFFQNIKETSNSIAITQKIIKALEKPYVIDEHTIKINFVAGISIFPTDGTNAQILLDKAKTALAEARKSPNKVGFFSPTIKEKAFKGLTLREDIEKALEKREFVFFYQPYVDVEKRIAGCECLVRWIKNDEIVPPGDFIPFLEETGLIVKVEESLAKLYVERLSEISPMAGQTRFSFNISPISITKGSVLKIIQGEVKKRPDLCKSMNIEIVERSFLDISKLEKDSELYKLLECGVTLTVDDFGTGYSALSYVTQFPIDYLKIDISFTRKILTDPKTKSLVSAIVHLCKSLNIKTIAEGVETEEQFEALKNLGCDYFQGFLFYKPMDEDIFLKLLEKQQEENP